MLHGLIACYEMGRTAVFDMPEVPLPSLRKVIEFYGGVKWLLQQFFFGEGAMALTLGHTVLGQTDAALDVSHGHEMVHVRQFERWGPLMGPAYLGCSLVLWLMRRRPYRDNPFERQAYEEGGGAGRDLAALTSPHLQGPFRKGIMLN
jgi:hypothetical protein